MSGKMKLEIGAEISGLQAGLNKARNLVNGFGKSIAGQLTGMFGARALFDFGKEAIVSAAQVAEGSKKLGLSAEEYQKLAYAAKQTGTDMDAVTGAFKKMSGVVTDAINGSKEAETTLNKLGISLDEVQNKSPQQLFELIAGALNQITDATKRSAYAVDIFGKGGMALIPMLDNFKELGREAQDVGAIMSGEAVEAAHELEKAMSKLAGAIKALFINSGLVEYLKKIVEEMTAIINNKRTLESAKKEGIITKEGFLKEAGARYRDKIENTKNNDERRKIFNESVEVTYDNIAGSRMQIISSEDYKKYNEIFKGGGVESITQPVTEKDLNAKKAADEKARLEKISREDAAAKFAENAAAQKEIDTLSKEASKWQADRDQKEYGYNSSASESIRLLNEKIAVQKLVNEGKGREAAIQEAVNAAEKEARDADQKTDPKKIEKLKESTGALYDLTQKSEIKPLQMEAPVISDSVKRIGGSIGGASDAVQNNQLTVQKEIATVLKEVKDKIAMSGGETKWA